MSIGKIKMKCTTPAKPERTEVADERARVLTSAYRITSATTPPSQFGPVLPADPRRLAFTVLYSLTSTPDWFLSPQTSPTGFGIDMFTDSGPVWITVKDHYCLPTMQWYAISTSGGPINILEIYRLF